MDCTDFCAGNLTSWQLYIRAGKLVICSLFSFYLHESFIYLIICLFNNLFKELHTANTCTEIFFLRWQSTFLYSFLLQLYLLSILPLPDLPDIPHDGGIAADCLSVLLIRHIWTNSNFLHT